MSMIEVGRALRPRRSLWGTLIFSLAAIGAILVGLVAMHSLNLEGGHSGHAAANSVAASADHHVAAGAADAADAAAVDPLAGPAGCDGDCEHSMTVMACILALMVTLIVLGATRALSSGAGIPRVFSPVLELSATLAPAVPPSLHVLSISRT